MGRVWLGAGKTGERERNGRSEAMGEELEGLGGKMKRGMNDSLG